MKKFVLVAAAALALSSSGAFASQTVDFHIKAGTGDQAWNTRDAMVVVHVGDTIHIVNDDTVNHRLHTPGEPCEHGPEMGPGQSYDCKVDQTFDPEAGDGPLYDHDVGPDAAFWLKVLD